MRALIGPLFWLAVVTLVGAWGLRQSRLFTLACPRCHRGWESPVPQGVCGGCGDTVKARGTYDVIELGRVSPDA